MQEDLEELLSNCVYSRKRFVLRYLTIDLTALFGYNDEERDEDIDDWQREYRCVVPPYRHRLGAAGEVELLYRSLSRLLSISHKSSTTSRYLAETVSTSLERPY